MHIAFITFTGLHPSGSWPATAASMANALERQEHKVTRLQVSGISKPIYWQARKALHMLAGQQFQAERQESVARELADSVNERLRKLKVDLVLCSSSLPVPYLTTTAPVAFWTDATFAGMLGFYPEFSRLDRGTVNSGMALEAKALQRADHAFYASEWAARSAVRDHNADPRRVHVVPFGPNLAVEPDRVRVLDAIRKRSRKVCRLLFIGYDWERKQGPLVVRTQQELEQNGIATELTIVGGTPELDVDHRRIHVLGRLDKSDPAQSAALEKAFREAHFLVVPSQAECYGMVYAEASAHGIPSIACETGGVGTVVRQERNGRLFPSGVSAATLAGYIGTVWGDPDRYAELAIAARDEFDDRLNWASAVEELVAVVEARSSVHHA